MRAAVLHSGKVRVTETPDPVPGSGELLLRTLSTAICASDVHFMDHPELGIDDPTGRSLYDADRDIVLGHEFIGEVIGHGPDCSDQFPVGTHVTSVPVRLTELAPGGSRIIGQHPDSQGSFAEHIVVTETVARAVPSSVSPDLACLTDAFAVGEFYVRIAAVSAGEIPIVIGAGAIGLSAVAALATRGVDPIIVADFNPERLELAGSGFGAHVLVNPAEQSPFDVWRKVRADRGLATGGPQRTGLPPVVFECVGAAGLIQQLVDAAEYNTRIFCAGGWYSADSLDITRATRQGVSLQFGGGPHREDWYGTLDAICSGRLDPGPSIGQRISLDEVPAALDATRRAEGPPRIIVHPNGPLT